jgi:hypothetical protein
VTSSLTGDPVPPGVRRAQVRVASASSSNPSPEAAVAEIADRLASPEGVVWAFVPAGYDLDRTGAALTRWAGQGVLGCTSAGGVGPGGYEPDAIVVTVLSGADVRARTVLISPLDDLDAALARVDEDLQQFLVDLAGTPVFAVLLSDGLSLREEALADRAMARLGDIPLIGGSAGDDLRFARTSVLAGGRFLSGAATLTLVATAAPWRRFRVQHHRAGDRVAVVTDADPAQRIVRTLNGRPAATEYAALTGAAEHALTPALFSAYPLVLRAGGGEWVRSVRHPEPDGSLRFLSAAEEGWVLRLGESVDPVAEIARVFADLDDELCGLSGALVFDCILRRLELQGQGLDGSVGRFLADRGAAGFSTYGEQYDGVHVNQTMVGVAFGG